MPSLETRGRTATLTGASAGAGAARCAAALDLLDVVGVDEEGERGAVGAAPARPHAGRSALALLVEVLELLAGELGVLARSKSPRLAIPSSSDQPIGKRYSMSLVPRSSARARRRRAGDPQECGADAEAVYQSLALVDPVR
jgi:hypothetical protein